MPSQYVYNLAKEKGVSGSVAEARWKMAKQRAEDEGHKDNWRYITGIFNTMMGKNVQIKESMDSSTITEIRAILRSVIHKPAPSDSDVRQTLQSPKWSEAVEFAQTVAQKPTDNDVQQVIDIIKQEFGLKEGLQENTIVLTWEHAKYVLEATWIAFEKAVSSSSAAAPYVFAVLLFTMAWLAVRLGEQVVRAWVLPALSWVYRKWKMSDLRVTDIEVSPGSKMGVMLKHLEVGKTYTFNTQVSTQDAYHPLKAFVLLPANTPWVFRGFVQPRWMKEQYLLLEPLAGPMRGEERLVAVKVAEQVFFVPPGYVGESLQKDVLDY